MAEVLEIHPENPQPRLISTVVDVIKNGGLIAYPTDSCYALGCSLDNKDGIERITRIRQLNAKHHFTLMCHDFAQLGQFVIVDNSAFRTIKSLTPGPYTFILKATKEVPRRMLHAKKKTVGARIPDNRLSLDLIERVGEPIRSSTLLLPGEDEPLTDPVDVEARIGKLVDVIVASGVPGTTPSTVVDFSSGAPVVRRVGAGSIDLFDTVDED
ncbi:L-threonylcarbamoyladenylate synthase [Brevibacterium paucivorans]|uniref:Threonylcarbamoyl-AMP synthase n=1 Tax=Brevibacterium paucivorans TaxID=170994 RepID=A0A2N6VRI8_9MICO|nr:L-threonylcarbamoyladenylate synthase [Brevibacterium paucivorans]PMD06643.1 threonylcarbamoyl-AMP synthase [Brevibacterium paucivorans]